MPSGPITFILSNVIADPGPHLDIYSLNDDRLLPRISVFTEFTSLDNNISPKQLRNAILDAQELRLKPLIGSTLLDKLTFGFSNNTLNSDYLLLLNDYVCM